MRGRILRILEYEGEIEWLTRSINTRGVKGQRVTDHGTIREALLGDTIELLKEKEVSCEQRTKT